MFMNPRSPLALLVTIWLCSAAGAARACTCAPATVPGKFAEAEAVFLAEVIEHGPLRAGDQPLYAERQVNLQVIRIWKGVSGAQAGVLTGESSAACGVSVSTGQQLLVYGYDGQAGLSMSICSTVSDPGQIAQDIAELDQLQPESTEPSVDTDPQWPPFGIRTPVCGAGFWPFAILSAAGLTWLRLQVDGVRTRSRG